MLHGLIAGALVMVTALKALATVLWGWGTLGNRFRGEPSRAMPSAPDTPLGALAAVLRSAHPDQTGIGLIEDDLEAFALRARLARESVRSLDLMHYVWSSDLTGRLLMAEVLAAADRGVRVRLLLDDIGAGHSHRLFLALHAHPRIELRLFNPAIALGDGLERGIGMAWRMATVSRRMHGRAWIADGAMAISGGRNIGDACFRGRTPGGLHDLDLLILGPVTDQLADLFDSFWNSGLALPITATPDRHPRRRARALARIARTRELPEAQPFIQAADQATAPAARITSWNAQTRLLADPPQKTLGTLDGDPLTDTLAALLRDARQRLRLAAPHFAPGEAGTRALGQLARQGTSVEVLTTSLAATDVIGEYLAYARQRPALLRAGVRLHEARPTRKVALSLTGLGGTGLHTKICTLDGRLAFVGSLIFDRGAGALNADMGLLLADPRLVARIDTLIAAETDRAWQLALTSGDRLQWREGHEEGPRSHIHDREPMASLWRRACARLLGWLPVGSRL